MFSIKNRQASNTSRDWKRKFWGVLKKNQKQLDVENKSLPSTQTVLLEYRASFREE